MAFRQAFYGTRRDNPLLIRHRMALQDTLLYYVARDGLSPSFIQRIAVRCFAGYGYLPQATDLLRQLFRATFGSADLNNAACGTRRACPLFIAD